jgi:DNA-binding NarL/FixJ family response regulator
LGALRLALEGSIYVPPQYFPCAMVAPGGGSRIDYKAAGLTERQRHILGLLTAGLSNKEISEAIQIAEGTVKVHVAAVFQVLQVGTRAEAVRVAKRMGLFSPS